MIDIKRIDAAIDALTSIKHRIETEDVENKRLEKLSDLLIDIGRILSVSTEAMRGESRKEDVVAARHIFCYHAYEQLQCYVTDIGKFLYRDHSTIVVAKQNYLDRYKYDPKFRSKANEVKKELYGY